MAAVCDDGVLEFSDKSKYEVVGYRKPKVGMVIWKR
jgi:hypothetical protein